MREFLAQQHHGWRGLRVRFECALIEATRGDSLGAESSLSLSFSNLRIPIVVSV